jgi:hypothetical protein
MLIKFIVVLAALSLATTGINAQTRSLQRGRPGGGRPGGNGGGGNGGGGNGGGGNGGGGNGGGGNGGGGNGGGGNDGGGGNGGGSNGGGGNGGGGNGGGGNGGGGGAVIAVADVLDYQAISAEIESLIRQNPNRGPTIVRLAWHSSGTYDELTQTGGSDGGTIRFEEELFRTANAGLAPIINVLRPVYTAYAGVGLSYADLFTLAGGKQPD